MLDAIDRFERQHEQITPAACRANAERFSAAVFRRAFMAEVTRTIAAVGARGESPAERIDTEFATEPVGWQAEPASQRSWGR
jgi:hypothetical protein